MENNTNIYLLGKEYDNIGCNEDIKRKYGILIQKREMIQLSGLLNDLISSSMEEDDNGDICIIVPNVSHDVLISIVKWMYEYITKTNDDDKQKKYQKRFISRNENEIVELLEAANFLSIKKLKDFLCQYIANKLSKNVHLKLDNFSKIAENKDLLRCIFLNMKPKHLIELKYNNEYFKNIIQIHDDIVRWDTTFDDLFLLSQYDNPQKYFNLSDIKKKYKNMTIKELISYFPLKNSEIDNDYFQTAITLYIFGLFGLDKFNYVQNYTRFSITYNPFFLRTFGTIINYIKIFLINNINF